MKIMRKKLKSAIKSLGLVEKAIRIVNDLGVSTMTPAETREKLKLKNYK